MCTESKQKCPPKNVLRLRTTILRQIGAHSINLLDAFGFVVFFDGGMKEFIVTCEVIPISSKHFITSPVPPKKRLVLSFFPESLRLTKKGNNKKHQLQLPIFVKPSISESMIQKPLLFDIFKIVQAPSQKKKQNKTQLLHQNYRNAI